MRCIACDFESPPGGSNCGRCGAPFGDTPAAGADPAGGLAPLVGRREEMGLLLQRFAEAREGHGQVVMVAGEPGIGKTHLARAFVARLAAEGRRSIECWCSPDGANTPLGPFVQLLRRLAAPDAPGAAGEGSPPLAGLEALARRAALPPDELVPLFAELLALPLAEPYAPLEISPGARRRQTLEAFLALLMGLAEERPLAFVAEDLHWSDPSSLELFELLVARGMDAPLMTVLTFRPEFEPPWALRPRMSHLPLARLNRREAAELIDAATGSTLPPAVRHEIARRADGVPLFVVEITRSTLGAAAAAHRGAAGKAMERDIPATLQESLTSRLELLGSARPVAQLAAAIGRSFSQELLAAVSPLGEAALALELDRLVAAGLLQRSGFGWRSRYEFRHVLLQETAYRSLPESDRRRLHEAVLRALDERFPEVADQRPELVARHATEAGLSDRATGLWRQAGRRAFERSASAEAVAHFRRALELVATRPPGGERDRRELTLLTDLTPALIASRGYTSSEVKEVNLRAGELCQRVDAPEQKLRVLAGVLAFHFSRAHYAHALELLDSLETRRASDELQLVAVHFRQGILNFTGEFAAAREHCELADALSRSRTALPFTVGHDLRTGVLSTDVITLWHLGYPEQALEKHLEAMAWARRIEHPYSQLFALHMGLWLRQLRSEPEIVAVEARTLKNRGAELESPYFESEGEVLLAWALTCREPPDREPVTGEGGTRHDGRELRRLRRAIAEHEKLGMRFGRTYRLSLLAGACLRFGRLEETATVLADARDTVDRTGEGFCGAEVHRLHGELLLAQGGDLAHVEAETALRNALDTARDQRARSLELRSAVSLGRLWQYLDRPEEARELVSEVYGWFTEGDGLPDLIAARVLLDELS